MRIALLTTDNREHQRTYEETTPRFGPAIESVLDGLSCLPELEVHIVSCTQQAMNAPEKLSDNTWFHLLHVSKSGWLRTGYQGCVRAIRRKLRKLQPDLVHGEGAERECALSAVLSGYPNLVTIHGNIGQLARSLRARIGSFLWCAARLESYALQRAGGVLCNSAYTEQIVRRYNSRTWRVPNALRRAFFETPISHPARAGVPILLNVGGIIPYKRQNELFDIAERLHRDGARFEIVFVAGVNSRHRYVRAFVDRLESAKESGFARVVRPLELSELIALYDSADALIHFSSEESFGLVVAEALSRNLKFFGARVGGVPDIAEGVEGAELFDLRDEQGLREAITRWLGKGAPRPTAAAAIMRQRYHPDVIAHQHLEVYRDLLARG